MNGLYHNIQQITSLIVIQFKIYLLEAMNLFEFLRNHKDTKVSQSYGDILEGKSDITDGMTEVEKNVCMQLKNNDKKRIIGNQSLQHQMTPKRKINVSGIGDVIQIL